MDEQRNSMEDKILACAKELFLKNGYDGTSTTQIAKLAGCNQALIHYYFRSKEKLLETIINQNGDIIFNCFSTIPEGCNLKEKICHIIDIHFEFLENNPELPLFLLQELKNNQKLFVNLKGMALSRSKKMLDELQKEIDSEVANGKIKDIKALDLILDILSLDVFSFLISSPVVLLNKDDDGENVFLKRRKEHVKEIITSLMENK
ncbi:MAG: TetR/AcrR family transcriptional regulator [Candidatus Onthomorpha sp.]